MQPEFTHYGTVFNQCLLKIVNFIVCLLPARCAGIALDPFYQYPPVPTSVVYRRLSRAWNVSPKPPQIMMGKFFIARRRNSDDLILARIEGVGNATDSTALAGRIPALKHDYTADTFSMTVTMEFREACLITFQTSLVFRFG